MNQSEQSHLSHWNVLLVVKLRVLRYTNTHTVRPNETDIKTERAKHKQVPRLTPLIYKFQLERHTKKELNSAKTEREREGEHKKMKTYVNIFLFH